ncbi:MAG: hypothetical protein Q27BPR15_13080 [Rhodobacter sp. CACIA14H1]|nr:MAG: hypothetical protein Q27BPR15_13080 [Rhodobacter sp. CACIA14H1]
MSAVLDVMFWVVNGGLAAGGIWSVWLNLRL